MLVARISKALRAPKFFAAAVVAAAGLAGVAGAPAAAQARDHWHVDVVVPGDYCPPPAPVVVEQPQQVWVEPVYRTVCDRQWVPPVVQTTCGRVWCPPVTQTVDRPVYVPAQYGVQDVTVVDWRGRPRWVRQQVLLVPAHTETRCETVEVAPGHYEDRPQEQVVCDGHWATVDRQELVSAGHWETRAVAVAVPDYCPPRRAEVRVRFPF